MLKSVLTGEYICETAPTLGITNIASIFRDASKASLCLFLIHTCSHLPPETPNHQFTFHYRFHSLEFNKHLELPFRSFCLLFFFKFKVAKDFTSKKMCHVKVGEWFTSELRASFGSHNPMLNNLTAISWQGHCVHTYPMLRWVGPSPARNRSLLWPHPQEFQRRDQMSDQAASWNLAWEGTWQGRSTGAYYNSIFF